MFHFLISVLHFIILVPPCCRKGTGIVLWTDEQELELEMLFEEYKDSDGNRSHNPVAFQQGAPCFLMGTFYVGDATNCFFFRCAR